MNSANDFEKLDRNFLWINCFKCLDFYGFKKNAFFLLNCKHISCVKCLKKVDDLHVICPCCKKPSRYWLINNDMPASVKKYFHPRPYHNKLSIDWDVINFQVKCHKRLIARLLSLVSVSLNSIRN